MLERAELQENETVLVVGGGGGVSAAAMAFAVAFHARGYVTSRSQEKIDQAIVRGASGGFLSEADFGVQMADLGGADLVVDNVGAATLRQSMKAAKPGGTIAICGGTSGPKFELTLPHLFFKELEIMGSTMGTHAQFARATEYVGSGRVDVPVDRVFAFEQLSDAMAYLESGEQAGKVAISRSTS
jgi:zinc-binding alcohol dehydrogenase/oxidoreductase